MKEKIIMFVIGFLAGAIITTGIFLIIRQNDTNKLGEMRRPGNMQMQDGKNINDSERPELPNGETQNGEAPSGEKPSGEKPNGRPGQKANNTNSSSNETKTTESNT